MRGAEMRKSRGMGTHNVEHLLHARQYLQARLALALQTLRLGDDHALELLHSLLAVKPGPQNATRTSRAASSVMPHQFRRLSIVRTPCEAGVSHRYQSHFRSCQHDSLRSTSVRSKSYSLAYHSHVASTAGVESVVNELQRARCKVEANPAMCRPCRTACPEWTFWRLSFSRPCCY